MDRGAWRAAVHGVSKSWTQLSDYHCCHILRPRYVATEVCSDKCLSFTTLDGFSSRKIQHSSTDRKHNVRRNNRLLTQTAPGLARHWVTICPCVPDLSHLGFSLFNLYNIIDNTWLVEIFPGSLDGKASAYNAGDPGSIPGSVRFPWRRKWQPPPVFMPGKPHGPRSLVGYSPLGHKESDTTERLLFTSLEILMTSTNYSTQRLPLHLKYCSGSTVPNPNILSHGKRCSHVYIA